MNTRSDQDLVIAARSGESDAFAALVERYAAAVRAVAQHIVRNHHASEDIAQDAFVLAYKQMPQLRMPALFGRWMLRIARQQALLALRSQRFEVSLDAAAEVAGQHSEGVETEHLLAAMMRLPERERRLLMLRYFNGHSVAEIARITGRPVGTITKQLSRGHARLREYLTEVAV